MIYMAMNNWKAGRKQWGRKCWQWRMLAGEENKTNENNENVIEIN